MKHKIKTIDLQVKEWFDRANGYGYFSAQMTINYGLPGERTLYLPMQYGYGNHSEYEAFKTLQKEINQKALKECKDIYWRFYSDHGIVYRYIKQENCLKRDVEEWGLQS